MTKNYIKILFINLLICISCEKQTSWNFKATENFIVADCIITNEFKNHELKLTSNNGMMNSEPTGVSGAIIELSDGISSIPFTEDISEAGKYVSINPFRATVDRKYQLVINYNNLIDTAFSEMRGITPLQAVEIIDGDTLFRFIYIKDKQPSMTEVFYNWSDNENYCTTYGSCHALEVFYTLNDIDVSKEFAPDKKIIEFPHNTQIIRKKYSLSPDHQEFIRSLLLETEWRGGIFDTEPGNIPTNFRNGIKGWFAACMVLSDTTYFK